MASKIGCPEFNYVLVILINFLFMLSAFITGTAAPQFIYDYFRRAEGLDVNNGSSPTRGCVLNEVDPNSTSATEYKDQTTIQQKSAQYSLYGVLITFIPAIIYSIVVGPVSDLKGRKFLMIVGIIGTLVLFAMYSAVSYFKLTIYYMYIASFVYGSSGSFASVVQATNAYIADVTSADNKRSIGVTLLAVGTGVATIIGTFVAGYMIETWGYISNFVFSFGISTINLILVICFLPETVQTRKIDYRKQAVNSVRALISFYTGSEFKGQRWKYILLIASFMFTFLRDMGINNLEKYFVLNNPFCWGPVKISWFFTIKSIAFNVIGIILVKVLQFCTNDVGIACLGSLSTAGFFVIYAFAENDMMLYIYHLLVSTLAVAVGVLGDMVFPMIRASLSKMAPSDKQGAVFSGTCAVETLCCLFTGIMLNAVYGATVGFMKGFVFLLTALFSIICAVLLGILLVKGRNDIENTETKTTDSVEKEENVECNDVDKSKENME